MNRSSSLSLIISSCYFLMKICSFYTLLHGTRISHRKNSIIQISPRVNNSGLIRTGGLFQNLGLHGGLFEYGGLIGTGGLNDDLRYIYTFLTFLTLKLIFLQFFPNKHNNKYLDILTLKKVKQLNRQLFMTAPRILQTINLKTIILILHLCQNKYLSL